MMKEIEFPDFSTNCNAPDKAEILNKSPDPLLFDGLSADETWHWKEYLYTPKFNLRNHVISLYDPFASRKKFPAGRRWCVNVYVGCSFACKYCYIQGYIRDPFHPRPKKNFEKLLKKDLQKLYELDLHPAPIHISNSTDPLQPLEKIHKNTLFLLNQLQQHQERFTTITILTKNPVLLCQPAYLDVIKDLKNFQVEVTCPFKDDNIRKFFAPAAPDVETTLDAIRNLRKNNITVALRVDPIFPREPLPPAFFDKPALKDYDAPRSHTEKDILDLIKFASDVGCKSVIVSPLKLVVSRFGKSDIISDMVSYYRKLYAAANQGKPIKKGASYRMPWGLYRHWIYAPKSMAESLGIPLIFCKNNLIRTY